MGKLSLSEAPMTTLSEHSPLSNDTLPAGEQHELEHAGQMTGAAIAQLIGERDAALHRAEKAERERKAAIAHADSMTEAARCIAGEYEALREKYAALRKEWATLAGLQAG